MRFMALLLLLIVGSASAQIDWQYINQSNTQALESFLDDHLTAEKFQKPEDRGCCRSWKGHYNCTDYGIALWVLQEYRHCNSRSLKDKARRWLKLHVNHLVSYGYDWTKHEVGGEGVMLHPVWKQGTSNDSDRLRHVHLAPYCALYMDPTVLSIEEKAALKKVIVDWADNFYLKIDWLKMRNHGKLFQYGRGMVPARGLIQMFEMTQDYKYLMAAQYIFLCTYWEFDRPVGKFKAYDTGYEGEKRTEKLLYYAAHFNMEPWQIAFTGEVAAYIHQLTFDPYVRAFCRKVILDITNWVVRQDIPYGDLEKDGDGKLRLSFLQGGSLFGTNAKQLDPLAALNLDPNVEFYPLAPLRAHYWDGGYFKKYLPDLKLRAHYPRRAPGSPPPGPTMSHPLLYNWADMLLTRFFITGDPKDLAWARWAYRDSKYFANRSSVVDKRKLSKPDKIHYGTGNISTTRSFAWWARGSLWARRALHGLKGQ